MNFFNLVVGNRPFRRPSDHLSIELVLNSCLAVPVPCQNISNISEGLVRRGRQVLHVLVRQCGLRRYVRG